MKKCLDENAPQVLAAAYLNGWPADPTAFDNADSIMLYMDGGGHTRSIHAQRLAEIDQLMKHGVGLCLRPLRRRGPEGKGRPGVRARGSAATLRPSGRSIRHWDAMTKATLAKDHPITRGVKPFDDPGRVVLPHAIPAEHAKASRRCLSRRSARRDPRHIPTTPTAATRRCGPTSARTSPRSSAGRPSAPTAAAATASPAATTTRNWGNDDYRKLMLNAILWTAKAEVPSDGVNSTVTEADLKANLDKKGGKAAKYARGAARPEFQGPVLYQAGATSQFVEPRQRVVVLIRRCASSPFTSNAPFDPHSF